jgi:hypothetical protein
LMVELLIVLSLFFLLQRYDKFLGIAKELLQLELNNFIMKIDQTRMSSKISSK